MSKDKIKSGVLCVFKGRDQDKVEEGEKGGEGVGGWAVGGKEGSWIGGKRESKGRIEVRLPLLRAPENSRNRLSGNSNSSKEITLTCI